MQELRILIVDDDQDTLDQLVEGFPDDIDGKKVRLDKTNSFEEAKVWISETRYDVVVTDIYRDREDKEKIPGSADEIGREIVDAIRGERFCGVIVMTTGVLPENLAQPPFVVSLDKTPLDSEALAEVISKMLATGVLAIIADMHSEVDRFAGSYVWGFIVENWNKLEAQYERAPGSIARMVKRRLAVQLSRLEGGEPIEEREFSEPSDYYLYPPVSKSYRLGTILVEQRTGEFYVVATPHCYLVLRDGKPKADYVLVARCVDAGSILDATDWPKKELKQAEALRQRTGVPGKGVGTPDDRYCYLPGFVDIPDLLCDLLQLRSITADEIVSDFDQIAVLDAPYAEAVQAHFGAIYGRVGLPVLGTEHVQHHLPTSD